MTITTARSAFFNAALSTPLSDQASEKIKPLYCTIQSVLLPRPPLTEHTSLKNVVVDHSLPVVLFEVRLPVLRQIVVLQRPVGEDLAGHDVVDPVGLRAPWHVRSQQVDVGLSHQPIAAYGLLQLLHRLFVLDRKAETGNVDRAGFGSLGGKVHLAADRFFVFREKPFLTDDANDS